MNATSAAVATAVIFVWLGMVLAISFLEAPLKFRAPGVTVPIGLGIGRIVFRALNRAELVLATAAVASVAVGDPPLPVGLLTGIAALLLAVQLLLIRPRLNRRSDRVLAGETLPRSHAHLLYVVTEALKVLALLALGICLLTV
ncbi:hypothetical protein I2W78_39055 [Streptomyces spinoverrucosus]|uniref:hypothetical protein n=1 Tax=Streptomyces spinoverrucosus TaxID=284043 RepID=UPI0018C44046|nr:hypothetical protein [Streptomyces spinoverrucosus]MBG0857689.1 hypothetical protein [Streptomyces spinoverrucosus]